ncbi:AAA family ATPase [candidate division KSB1 bacterium]|nr:AAA family ATPase [candidate division KSB1 bacterium]
MYKQFRIINAMLIIIITGLPATGKTTLGRKIADRFGLPFFSKDEIKEQLFDTIGTGDREWSRKLSRASNALLMIILQQMIEAGRFCIVESNFPPEEYDEKFRLLVQNTPFRILQIICKTERPVLQKRLEDRARSGSRHPGHLDGILLKEFADKSDADYQYSVKLNDRTIIVNTTQFEEIDYPGIFMEIENALKSGNED